MPALQPTATLTAGDAFIRWYVISWGGSPIPTNTVVKAALVDTIAPLTDSELIIIPRQIAWNPTGGTAAGGAWELEFQEWETALLRKFPDDRTGPLKVSAAFIEIQVSIAGFPAFHDPISIGKGVI